MNLHDRLELATARRSLPTLGHSLRHGPEWRPCRIVDFCCRVRNAVGRRGHFVHFCRSRSNFLVSFLGLVFLVIRVSGLLFGNVRVNRFILLLLEGALFGWIVYVHDEAGPSRIGPLAHPGQRRTLVGGVSRMDTAFVQARLWHRNFGSRRSRCGWRRWRRRLVQGRVLDLRRLARSRAA